VLLACWLFVINPYDRYWEIVETTRRLMLTAILSVCDPGTSQQIVFSLLLALMYVKLCAAFAPYDSSREDILAETGQYQILFTFLGALIMQNNLLGEEYNGTVGAFLVMLNLGVLYLSVYYTVMEIKEEQEELDAEISEEDGSALEAKAAQQAVEAEHDGHVTSAADGGSGAAAHLPPRPSAIRRPSHSYAQSTKLLKAAVKRRQSIKNDDAPKVEDSFSVDDIVDCGMEMSSPHQKEDV
jgi:hypothetical protein